MSKRLNIIYPDDGLPSTAPGALEGVAGIVCTSVESKSASLSEAPLSLRAGDMPKKVCIQSGIWVWYRSWNGNVEL